MSPRNTKVTCPTCQGTGVVDQLSKRELEVLVLTAEGKTVKDIAIELGVSVKTVEVYKTRLMAKIGAHSSLQAVKYAVENGYVKWNIQEINNNNGNTRHDSRR